MSKAKLGVLILVILSATVLAACSGGGDNARINAPWVTANVAGGTVSIPVSEVEKNKIEQFRFDTGSGNIAFLAYELDKQLYVRADICVPCRSEEFSLQGDVLICDTCGTVFSARTGEGISGACVNFPKAAVTYELKNANVVLNGDDLVQAYVDTLKPGLP